MDKPFQKRVVLLVASFLLFAIVFALFAPAIHYGFVALDDPAYVTQNRLVLPGLSLHTLRGAFSTRPSDAAIYVPLLWISLMADVSLFGASAANPAPFHAVNITLHAANSVLFFFLLLRITTLSRPSTVIPPALVTRHSSLVALLPPFLLALLWALHPLRVESVAWVTERKDVLSLFFAFLSLLAYLPDRIGDSGGVPPSPCPSALGTRLRGKGRQCLALLAFASALLVKPTLVPFPILLVSIDVLVLRRSFSRRILLSKTHFFILALAAALSTLGGHSQSVVQLPVVLRLAHLPQNFFHYLFLSFVPGCLTPLDPRPVYAWGSSFLAVLLLGGLLLLALRLRHRAPVSTLGVFWFFLFLIPVAGLSTIPNATVADRFSYIPALGLSLAFLPAFRFPSSISPVERTPNGRTPFSPPLRISVFLGILAIATALFATVTARTLPHWRSTEAFFARVRRFSPRHPLVALHDAKSAIASSGDFQTAFAAIHSSLRDNPNRPQLICAMADCIANIEGPLPAIRFLAPLRPAKGLPFLSTWSWQMAQLSLWCCRYADAIAFADLAQASFPSMDTLHANIQRLRVAASVPPDSPDALPHYISQWMTYERADALGFFRRFIAANPDRPDILANIAWILATASWSPAPPSEALVYASRALALAGDCPPAGLLDTYAAALANAADFPAAAAAQERAISLLPPDSPSLPAYQARLGHYLQSAPFRQDIGISG